MYGSYGSYSSMSIITGPMDMPSRSYHASDASCAFPSWPRRSSLSEPDYDEPRASAYLSDEDLFLNEPLEDDARSVSSYGSTTSPQLGSPNLAPTEAEIEEMRQQQAEKQRELVRFLMTEKERRRQAAKAQKQRKGGSSSHRKGTSPKSKLSSMMTPIAEVGE